MSSKKDSGSSNKSAGNLRQLRSQIDKLDMQILKMINERADLAAEVGKIKSDTGADLFSPAREEEILQNVLQANKGPLDPNSIRAIFRELMSASRALHRLIKVAYLGPEYSFSHVAAIEQFGSAVEFMRVGTIAAVFEEVNRGHAEYGVVPLENSTDGRIADTLDMFIRLPQIKIGAEVRMKIHHNLLATCAQQEIRRVYSKPQALSQCRNWLAKNVPHAQLIEVASTSVAAELAQREPGAAAVAGRQAAVRYGLNILFPDIEDYPHNETRFAVVGLESAERSNHDKTAIMFQVPHEPGTLVEALNIFKSNKVNLTWIESFPARTMPKQEYIFFVDFEGHYTDAKVKKTLDTLAKVCEKVVVLGSFPKSEPID